MFFLVCLLSLVRTVLSEHCTDESRSSGEPYRTGMTEFGQKLWAFPLARRLTPGRDAAHLPLRNRSSWLTRSVPQNVASITARMFHQILLVVFLSRIEFRCRHNFCRDRPIEFTGFFPPRLHTFRGPFLRLVAVENCRTIL